MRAAQMGCRAPECGPADALPPPAGRETPPTADLRAASPWLNLNSKRAILAGSRAQVIDFARPEFRREKCVMLNSALYTPIFLDRSRHFWAANRRQGPFDLVPAALGSLMGALPISGRRSASGKDGRLLRLRTPAIRCDRPTVQGPPAFSPAQCPRAGGRPILPQRTSGVMLKTTRVRASIWSRTPFQNAVCKLSHASSH